MILDWLLWFGDDTFVAFDVALFLGLCLLALVLVGFAYTVVLVCFIAYGGLIVIWLVVCCLICHNFDYFMDCKFVIAPLGWLKRWVWLFSLVYCLICLCLDLIGC